jgi:hypothetical protein
MSFPQRIAIINFNFHVKDSYLRISYSESVNDVNAYINKYQDLAYPHSTYTQQHGVAVAL